MSIHSKQSVLAYRPSIFWVSLLFVITFFVVIHYGITEHDGEIFDNPAKMDVFKDKQGQGYLVGNDSYYFLYKAEDQYKIHDNGDFNLIIEFYRIINTVVERHTQKELKYYLYYVSFITGMVCVSVFFVMVAKLCSVAESTIATSLLITCPSIASNTQLGLIDHNSFYVLGFIVVLFLSFQKRLWVLTFVPLTLLVVSTFWNSWFLFTLPVASIVFVNFYQIKRINIFLKFLAVVIPVVALIKVVSTTSYFDLLIQKVTVISGLKESIESSDRLAHTQELQSISPIDLIQADPITGLFIAVGFLLVFRLKNKVNAALFLTALGYLVLTILFVRTSVFFVIAAIFFIIKVVDIKNQSKPFQVVFAIILSGVMVLNIFKIIDDHVRMPRMTDNDIKELEVIKEVTPDNAIILSWWTWGFQINAISHRYSFLDPGANTSPERLALLSRVFNHNDRHAIRRIREIACQDLRIDAQRCTAEDYPVYLYINNRFKYLHSKISYYDKDETNYKNAFYSDLSKSVVDDIVYSKIMNDSFSIIHLRDQ